MMIDLLLVIAAQVQTVRLPPVQTPQPVPAEPTAPVELTGLPDLVVRSVRMVNEETPEFEIANVGRARAAGPVRVKACAYLDIARSGELSGSYKIHCSAIHSSGALDAGESRWVRINCYLASNVSMLPGISQSRCVELEDRARERRLAKLTAWVDPVETDLGRPEAKAPVQLQSDCSDNGCVRELNEGNNQSEFLAPFAGGERG